VGEDIKEGMSLGQMTPVVSTLLIILIGAYLITSANAGVITTILSGGDTETPPTHRILWGILLALLTAVLLLAGGLETLQAAVITAALPFSIVVLGMCRPFESTALRAFRRPPGRYPIATRRALGRGRKCARRRCRTEYCPVSGLGTALTGDRGAAAVVPV